LACATASLTSCHDASTVKAPRDPSDFGLTPGANRIFGPVRHVETEADKPYAVQVPRHVREVIFHVYCRHSGGSLQVKIADLGAGVAGKKLGASGEVFQGPNDTPLMLSPGPRQVTVQAPLDATWAIAIDVIQGSN
jgi:hypothetical protein